MLVVRLVRRLASGASAGERISVPRERVRVSFSRSSGAGGQNVNKVNTKAELRFDLSEAGWLPDDVRRRLTEQNPARVNARAEFFLASDVHRTCVMMVDSRAGVVFVDVTARQTACQSGRCV